MQQYFKHTREISESDLEHGDLVLFAPDGSLNATLIQILTRSHYHHVALFDGDGMVIEAMPGGVRRYPLGDRAGIGLRLPVKSAQKRDAITWAREQIGDPYDMRSLPLVAFDRIFPKARPQNPNAHRYTCAVFVAEAYHHAGVELLPGRDYNDILPGDFLELLHEAPKRVSAD